MNNIVIAACILLLVMLFFKVPVYISVLAASAVYFLGNPTTNASASSAAVTCFFMSRSPLIFHFPHTRFFRSCTNSRSIQIHKPNLPVARRKIAGILGVFQDFSSQPAAIWAVKLGAEAIGIASKSTQEDG